MVIQRIRHVFSDLTDNHEIDLANMTPEVKKAITDQRMKRYKFICFGGTAIMVLVDKAALLNRVYQCNHIAARLCTLYLTFALLSMLLGLIASSFPDSAPFAMPIAWNGTLQAFLTLNAFFHMRIIDVYPELLRLTISFLLTSILFSICWSFCARHTVHLVQAARHEKSHLCSRAESVG